MNKQLNPLLPWLVAGLVSQLLWSASAQVAYVNFEGKQTNPLRLSPDGTRLFAVNTPDARLSVFDVSTPSNPILIAEIPVGIEPVSVNPLSNDEAWVVNEVSDSLSIVSVSRGIVTDTLQASWSHGSPGLREWSLRSAKTFPLIAGVLKPLFNMRSGTVWKLPFRRQIGAGFTGCAICSR